ncbi:MAG TPA: acetolactate synthase small subunit [Stenotrophobium sp.]|jgi:acetolactate synthase-1/3 small subunit|nr:acetolactate synthase small subunit [Stenotrophobium sp.]
MRHIISILLQNEAGALARVAGMFSARGYNIESLSVAPTHDPSVSRLTLVTIGSDAVIDQIIKQTRKLIDVVEIADLAQANHIECELLMIKIAMGQSDPQQIIECVRKHRVAVLDGSDNTRMLQLAGTGAEVDAFIAEISGMTTVLEMVRSGVAAMARGHHVLSAPQ